MPPNVTILGCGYVGQALAQHWRGQFTVTATTTTPAKLPALEALADRAIVLRGDDPAALRTQLRNQQTVVVAIGAPNPQAYEATYLATAKTLVRVLPDLPALTQIIYTGSYAVYGDQQGAWVDETTPVAPATRNGEILAETEQVLLGARSPERRVCVFRLGGIYGPGRELIKIYRRVAGTTRPGTGEAPANWIHLADIVGAIAFAQAQPLDGLYNLVSSAPIPQKELLRRIFAAYDLPNVTWDPNQPGGRPYNARVSNRKLQDAGYIFRYPEIVETE